MEKRQTLFSIFPAFLCLAGMIILIFIWQSACQRVVYTQMSAFCRTLLEENPELIIITNELGYGVVPVDPFDRAWREAAGRTCCVLAAEAGQVYRVICGLGQALKR